MPRPPFSSLRRQPCTPFSRASPFQDHACPCMPPGMSCSRQGITILPRSFHTITSSPYFHPSCNPQLSNWVQAGSTRSANLPEGVMNWSWKAMNSTRSSSARIFAVGYQNSLVTIFFPYTVYLRSQNVISLIPAYPFKFTLSPFAGPFHRIFQSVGMILAAAV